MRNYFAHILHIESGIITFISICLIINYFFFFCVVLFAVCIAIRRVVLLFCNFKFVCYRLILHILCRYMYAKLKVRRRVGVR